MRIDVQPVAPSPPPSGWFDINNLMLIALFTVLFATTLSQNPVARALQRVFQRGRAPESPPPIMQVIGEEGVTDTTPVAASPEPFATPPEASPAPAPPSAASTPSSSLVIHYTKVLPTSELCDVCVWGGGRV